MTKTTDRTPDGRPVYTYSGRSRTAALFRWLTRAATGQPRPERGTVNSRTGRIKFNYGWKGGRNV